jgi:hypothetical protein
MKQYIGRYAELILFWGSLGLSSLYIILSPYNPSLDGPAHVYNAQLINYLLGGNQFIAQYFCINKIPIPNLLDHALLAALNIIFPVLVSQKILLLFCTIGLAFVFRKLIELYNPPNIGLSAFAIPLAHSFLYYLGFYNFCLSLVFMLWAMYYYAKHFSVLKMPPKTKHIVVLSILILCNYFASALSFMFIGMLFLLHEIWLISPLIKSGQFKQNKNSIKKRLLFFVSLWIPGLICFIIFLLTFPFTEQNAALKPFNELLLWIYNVRPFEVYGDFELGITRCFFWALLFIFLGAFRLIIKGKNASKLNGNSIFLVAAIFSLICFFIVPDNFSVGMMNTRLCFYFFLFLMLWLALQQNFPLVKWGGAVAIYLFYWLLFFTWHNKILKTFDEKIKEVVEASDIYIEPNTVVLPIDCTNNWIMSNMADYIAIHKPMVNLMDYELWASWFPVTLNKSTMPYISSGYQNTAMHVRWFNNYAAKNRKQIDYIFIFGNFNSGDMNASDFSDLKENLQNRYTLIFTSKDKWIHIYKNHI